MISICPRARAHVQKHPPREEGAADLLALEPVAEGDREGTGELHGGSFLGSQDPLGRSGPDGEQLDRPECGLTAIVGQRSDKWE